MLANLALIGISTFPLPVLGNTWIVDDGGGPGVDFTSIQAAIDAASSNDVVLVMPGTYAATTIDKALRVVGIDHPIVNGDLRVQNVPAGTLTVVSGLRKPVFGFALHVTSCDGTVVAEDMGAWYVHVTNCLDVRLRGIGQPNLWASVWMTNSRVEAVDCLFLAHDGRDQFCGDYDPTGYPAAQVDGGELHAARSTFRGGNGGDSWCPKPVLIEAGGSGGDGILLRTASARLLLTGIASNVLQGGQGGWSPEYGDAPDGVGLRVWPTCSARVSGATIVDQVTEGNGTITTLSLADPTLRMIELPSAGTNLTFRLVAPPGASAVLRIGAVPTILPIGGLEEDVLVAHAANVGSGLVQPNGVLGFNFVVPASWPRGTTVFAQATVTYPGGEVRRTHSIPIVVR